MTVREKLEAETLERINDLTRWIEDNEEDIVRYNNAISRCKEQNASYAEEIKWHNKILATLNDIK